MVSEARQRLRGVPGERKGRPELELRVEPPTIEVIIPDIKVPQPAAVDVTPMADALGNVITQLRQLAVQQNALTEAVIALAEREVSVKVPPAKPVKSLDVAISRNSNGDATGMKITRG